MYRTNLRTFLFTWTWNVVLVFTMWNQCLIYTSCIHIGLLFRIVVVYQGCCSSNNLGCLLRVLPSRDLDTDITLLSFSYILKVAFNEPFNALIQ